MPEQLPVHSETVADIHSPVKKKKKKKQDLILDINIWKKAIPLSGGRGGIVEGIKSTTTPLDNIYHSNQTPKKANTSKSDLLLYILLWNRS